MTNRFGRTLAMLWFYLTWMPLMRYTAAIALLALAVTLLLGLAVDSVWYLGSMVASGIALGLPLMTCGAAFRQVVGNMRIALVPKAHWHAALGLLLLAAITVAWLLACYLLSGQLEHAAERTLDPLAFTLRSFLFVSSGMLLFQWLAQYRAGYYFWLVFPLYNVFAPVLHIDDHLRGNEPVWALLTVGLWAAFLFAMRRPARRRGLAGAMAGFSGGMACGWFEFGSITKAPGTLMRGVADSTANRLAYWLVFTLGMPLLVVALFTLAKLFRPEAFSVPQLVSVFLLMNLYMGAVIAASNCEWAIRTRLLWLRYPGTRADLWRYLETNILWFLVTMAVFSLLIATLIHLTIGFAPRLLVMYVVCGLILPALLTYTAITFRMWALPPLRQAVALIAVIGAVTATMVTALMYRDNSALLLAIAGAATLVAVLLRLRVAHRFRRIDWCAIRPIRFNRNGGLAGGFSWTTGI
ncbi:MAG: hypothetical protein H6978_04285 [Gammaproteobacteria bacterium]|nr:hypothetical protein [Gammaproteobacteria bacterium]